jgi:hypothetical protein
VAAITGVGDDALQPVADERFQVGDHACEGVSVIRVAGRAASGTASARRSRAASVASWLAPRRLLASTAENYNPRFEGIRRSELQVNRRPEPQKR